MNKYILAFIVCLFLAAIGGPLLNSTSGSASIETLSGILSLAGAGLALITGSIGAWKLKLNTAIKVLIVSLVIAASAGSIVIAALSF